MQNCEFLLLYYFARTKSYSRQDSSGDRICIFGFSRGAYTARALAGMIHKVGLLPASNHEQVPFAYKMYARTDVVGWEQSTAFKKAFSNDVTIEFLGVWDTVNSVGLIPRRLPFTTSNTVVRTFRHAVALDERRAKFKANLWNLPMPHEAKLGNPAHPPASPNVQPSKLPDASNSSSEKHPGHEHHSSFIRDSSEEYLLSAMERKYSEFRHRSDVEEVWFAGCHTDVGGGSVSNKTRHSLARISLRWMVRECFKTQTGIMFDTERLKEIGLDPATLYPFVTPRAPPLPTEGARIAKASKKDKRPWWRPFAPKPAPPVPTTELNEKTSKPHDLHKPVSEEEEELKDAMSPIYDQLKIKKVWWILEWIPMEFRYQAGEDNHWVSYFGYVNFLNSLSVHPELNVIRSANRARSRIIPKQKHNGVKVHRSVKMRMEMHHESKNPKKQKKYTPRARLHVEPTWVD
ncbi:hypothetical protein HGRIS_006201 [Hohenbuehelia grisea]|uniref:T6SS Phospholipase effector Tle1-like catalytic domain-containing protein n=1 Tax=Hohenbuehelia grisea TaxID=104357 RepID=A0ABR3K0F7_9AGAR